MEETLDDSLAWNEAASLATRQKHSFGGHGGDFFGAPGREGRQNLIWGPSPSCGVDVHHAPWAIPIAAKAPGKGIFSSDKPCQFDHGAVPL